MSKSKRLAGMYKHYCTEFRNEQIVLGNGNIEAELLLVGEAPGRDEVKLGKPFVGTAGKNLSEFLNIIGIEREAIYITNAIKYRLSKLNPKTGKIINRPATKNEINVNRDFILKEIYIIRPKYVVTLGNVPLRAVTGISDITIGMVHGEMMPIELFGETYELYPLYHPASVIYNRTLKEIYINDMEKLKNILR
jgi:uracil-DNA glycosylase